MPKKEKKKRKDSELRNKKVKVRNMSSRGANSDRCNVHMCICATDCYILGRTNLAGFHKLYFYTQNCKLDFDRSLPNHISFFEIV